MTGTPPVSPFTSDSPTSTSQQGHNITPHIQSGPSLPSGQTSPNSNIVLSKGPTVPLLRAEQDNFSTTNPTERRPHSPLKRLASELDNDADANGNLSLEDEHQLHKRPSNHPLSRDLEKDIEMDGSDEVLTGTSPKLDEAVTTTPQSQPPPPPPPPPQSSSTNGTSETTEAPLPPSTAPSSSSEFPSVDQQIRLVLEAKHKALSESEDQYIISGAWLQRFMNQGEDSKPSKDDETPAEVGPIDNTDIAESFQKDLLSPPTDTAGAFKSMFPKSLQIPKSKLTPTTTPTTPAPKNTPTDDNPFADYVPLKQGTLGDDYEALPKAIWDMLVIWYGLAKDSPVIRRKVVNPTADENQMNLQIELHPPVFTIQKLRSSAPPSHKSLGAKAPAVVMVASKGEKFMHFLKRVKQATGSTRTVRLWKVTASESATPRRSRSPSPVFGRKKDKVQELKMEIDLNTFNELEPDRERVTAKDQTDNLYYKGRMNVDMAGLGLGGRIIVEEKDEAGEWESESSGKTLAPKQEPATTLSKGMNKARELVSSAARRTTPSQSPRSSSPAGGIMTRGREQKGKFGKPLGKTGLQNLGNTCYMNSALQCLRSVEELSKYFLSQKYKSELNPLNPLAHGGKVALAYGNLLNRIYDASAPNSYSPNEFKSTIGRFGPSFSGYGQQDTQEFLAFLLDGLHEDLNRIHKKPYVEKPDSTDEMIGNPAAIAELAQKCWDIYKARNDSAVADLFGGLYKSTLVCPECEKVSITFDPFMDLTLPLPVENIWSHEIVYVPLRGERPVMIKVDMEKSKGLRDLKEYLGRKFGVDPKKIMGSEVYKNKFFQHYDESKSISELINAKDLAYFYELEDAPTNFPSRRIKQKTRSMLNIGRNNQKEEDDDELAKLGERILVPVFTRIAKGGNATKADLVGVPFFIVLNKEEARDYDTIFRKVVEHYQSWTTTPLQEEEPPRRASPVPADTEMVEADAKVDAENQNISTTEGVEEGYVNVQMSEVEAEPISEKAPEKVLGFDRNRVPIHLNECFKIRVNEPKNRSVEVPTGWADFDSSTQATLMSSRCEVIESPTPVPRITEESDDEVTPAATPGNETPSLSDREDPDMKDASSDEDTNVPMSTASLGSFSLFANPPSPPKAKVTPPLRANSPKATEKPLVRLGEALTIDWTPDAYDSIFGGKDPQDNVKGFGFWETSSLEEVKDEEMERKRTLRNNRRKNGIHLEDCLDEFAKEEILSQDDPWYCPRCKEHRRASKTFELWKCPDILVIHLKRFSNSRSFRDKLDVLIEFPITGLDLTKRIGEPHEGKNVIYDLIAVDNHYGGLGGGHYTAYAKNFCDGKWYNFDDSHASEVQPNRVITPAAYLLFYRKRSSKPLGGPLFEEIVSQPGNLPQHVTGLNSTTMGPSPSSSPSSSRASSPGIGPSAPPPLLAFAGASTSSTLFGPSSSTDELPAYSQIPSDPVVDIDVDVSTQDLEDGSEWPADWTVRIGEEVIGPVEESVVELNSNVDEEKGAGGEPMDLDPTGRV